MATYYARKSGNVNATDVWATSAGGTAGDYFGSFTSSDTLMANSFTVTLNVNTTVLEVRNDTTGGATAGGGFTLNSGITLTANVYAGAAITVTFSAASPATATIAGNIYGSPTNAVSTVTNSNNGTLIINGNLSGSSFAGGAAANNTTNGTITVTGTVTGGSASNSANGINNSGAGIININGNVSGTTSYGASNIGSGTINIVGSVSGGVSGNGQGVWNNSSGTINITGNILGGATNVDAVRNASNGNIYISGNVTGVSATAVSNTSTGSVTITGTVTGGTASVAYGINNGSTGTVTIIGTAVASSVGIGAVNSSTGTLTVTRAKGNGFGNGSVGLTSQVGVQANQNGLTRVYEIEYGDLGQSPTSGPVFLVPASTNVALFYRSGTSKKTLVDASSSSGLLPNTSDVRNGVTYNAGTYTGTMNVPGAASVASGVAVDNTTGTAILTSDNIADIWNYPVSGISVSNSIGERLKNCSTVATMGQQLAAALNNVQ